MKTSAKVGAGVAGVAVLAMTVAFVQPHEGTILRGYLDPIKVVTACTGHTKTAVLGKVYTPEQCRVLLERDVAEHAEAIAPCIARELPVETHAALVSFAFNIGPTAFCKSTLSRKVRDGDLRGACDELPKWVWAGKKKWPGLVRRRAEERALCLRGLT